MQQKLITLLLCLLPYMAAAAKEARPTWLTKGVETLNAKRSNTSYRFIVVHSAGTDLQRLQAERAQTLATYIGQTYHVSGEEHITTSSEEGTGGGKLQETYIMNYRSDVSSEKFYARLVDEFWDKSRSTGMYEYHALFAVSEQGQEPVWDEFSVISPSGAAPVLMSVVPGVGQFYKGQKTKGLILFGAEAATLIAALYCDNQRSDNIKKMAEYPRQVREYSDRSTDWKTRRNICLGLAAGVWVYNIVDAIAVKGAPKVTVKPASGQSMSFTPMVSKDYAGLSLTYNF